jgi:hypothetical protein
MAYPYPPAPKKSNKTLLIVLAAALGVCLVCGGIAAGTGLLAMFSGSPSAPAAESPQSTATSQVPVLATTKPPAKKVVKPTSTEETALPTSTAEVAIQPEQPTEAPVSATSAPQTSGTFTDDFSTDQSNWPVETTQYHQVGYSQLQNYFISLLQPTRLAYVIPPHHFQKPFANVIISASVKPGSKDGGFGFLCGFQNAQNFYAVKVSGTKYTVYKTVQGQVSSLTSPQWIPADGIENVDQYGQIKLLVNCMGSSIGVEINGYGQKMVVDDANSFPAGDVAIFATSAATENTVNFDDFSLQVNP